jgi:dTDP-4-dehydrorhamnose reductase
MFQKESRAVKILVTGASGFVGWNLVNRLKAGHELTAVYNNNRLEFPCPSVRAELSDSKQVRALFKNNYDTVVHLAAVSNIDNCERDRDACTKSNLAATGNLVESAVASGCNRFIYFSTDQVYSGPTSFYREEDQVNPQNYYSEMKVRAERAVLGRSKSAVVVRLALCYGFSNPLNTGFLIKMIEQFRQKRTGKYFTDQFRTPVLVSDAVESIRFLLEGKPGHRTYNIGGADRVSRHEMAILCAKAFGLDEKLALKTTMSASPQNALRPADCSMNSSRFEKEFGFKFKGFDEGLATIKKSS